MKNKRIFRFPFFKKVQKQSQHLQISASSSHHLLGTFFVCVQISFTSLRPGVAAAVAMATPRAFPLHFILLPGSTVHQSLQHLFHLLEDVASFGCFPSSLRRLGCQFAVEKPMTSHLLFAPWFSTIFWECWKRP